MTSQKSSISTFSFTFWSALKSNFVLPLINMIALTLTVPVTCFFAIRAFSKSTYDPRTGLAIEEGRKITDYYKYFIFESYSQISSNVLIHLAVITFSILLGVVLFRFIASKKTVNVYYSLGISRKNLFVSKYLAGLAMLALSIILPFAACLVINISTFGSSPELWSTIIYHILGYCALAFTAFSLTAAVLSSVGTVIEGLTFTGILMLGPTMVIYGLQFLMSKLVLGSPFGYFYDENYTVTNALASKLSGFNPMLFLFKNVSAIGSLARQNPEDKFVWTAPVYSDIILWFAITAALFLLGITIFQKRKAEICGFLGSNKWLNFCITFLVGFFPLCVAISSPAPIMASILIGLAIFVFLYSIIDFALIRNIKEWVRGLYKLPIHLGISILIIIVFSSGLFGFSQRIPNIDSVKSVAIAPVTYSGVINPFSYFGFGDESFIYSVGTNTQLDGFETEKDLKTITGLHKLLIDAGKLTSSQGDVNLTARQRVVGSEIRISYQLKNGKTIDRFYSAASLETLSAFLALDKTDRYNELIMQNLTQAVTAKDSDKTAANKTFFQDENTMIKLLPNTLSSVNTVDLSPENRTALLNAIAKDLTEQTIEDRFFPTVASIGVIHFSSVSNEKLYMNEYGDYVSEKPADNTYSLFALVNSDSASIVITDKMENTLRFLKNNNLVYLFDKPQGTAFVSAQVLPATSSSNNPYYYGSAISLHFMGGWGKFTNEYSSFAGTYEVTDKALVDEIEANAHISYYNSNPGYYVRFKLANGGGYTTEYIPADKMPQSLMNAVDSHVKIQPQNPNNIYKSQ